MTGVMARLAEWLRIVRLGVTGAACWTPVFLLRCFPASLLSCFAASCFAVLRLPFLGQSTEFQTTSCGTFAPLPRSAVAIAVPGHLGHGGVLCVFRLSVSGAR